MFGPVLDIILPIFGLLMIGYMSARIGWFNQSSVRGLTRFVFDFGSKVDDKLEGFVTGKLDAAFDNTYKLRFIF